VKGINCAIRSTRIPRHQALGMRRRREDPPRRLLGSPRRSFWVGFFLKQLRRSVMDDEAIRSLVAGDAAFSIERRAGLDECH
jgi:hypothetical protein